MAKVDKDKASALHRAAMTMSLGANKNSIRVLYGRNVAENLDFQVDVKKGSRKDSGDGANVLRIDGLFLR